MKADNTYLEHHGIKGMKWGVRRTKAQLGYKVGFRKKKKKSVESKDTKSENQNKKTSKKKSKSVKDMSDEELRAKINRLENRLEMEKRYKDLSSKDISKGKKFTSRVINSMVLPAAEDIGKQLIKSAMAKVVNDKVTIKMGSEYKVYTNNKKKN